MFQASLGGLRRTVSAAADHFARRSQFVQCSEANLCRSRGAFSADGSGAAACTDNAGFSTAISLHDVLLEDETPFILNDRSERPTQATRNWFQRASSDTLAVSTADITEPTSTPSRPQFIQQTPTVAALLTLVEHLSGSLDHEDVAAALEHLLGLTSPDTPQDKSVNDQAIRAVQLLQRLLKSPMGATPSADAPRRVDNMGVSQVADLLQALSFARRDGEFARLRNSLVGDLLQHLLHTSDKAMAAACASAARCSSAQQLAGRELLRSATPHELARLADAVSRLAGCMESASSLDPTSPHHHLQCALNVRVAFSAVSAAALRQLEMCAVSPSTCGWDVEGLSGLVTALARLDHYNQALMDAVAVAAVNPGMMATAPPASLALLLSGFARLRHDSPELFRHAALQMRSSMHKLRPKDLAVAINAFESRHVSGTRWRNKPEADVSSSSSAGSSTAAAASPPQPRSEQLSPSASPTLAEYINNPSFFPSVGKPTATPGRTLGTRRSVPLDGLDQWDVSAAVPSGVGRTAPPGLAVRPMLRMDTKIEPWDLLAGGARKMYLWHLLDVSAAMG